MNILYVVNADIENPAFGNAQRTRLIYDALCKLGTVYILDVRPQGESWKGRKFLRLLPQKGFKRLLNAVWDRVVIRSCKKCLVPVYPFPLRWSIEKYFPFVKFDVVVARYLFHAGRMALWKVAPRLYIDIDDHPMQVFDTVYAPKFGLIRKRVSRKLNLLFVNFVLRKTAGCWISNPEQISIVEPMCKCALLKNIPFYVKKSNVSDFFCTSRNTTICDETFVFTVGLMRYAPNYRGIDIFLQTIWPEVCKALPHVRYKIVGKGLPEEYRKAWSKIPNVDLLGYVEDLSELYNKCVATVVPVSEGGGTCIKTLESLANSRVCLATPFGARGIPDEILADGRNGIVVYSTSESFVGALKRLMWDKEWRKKCQTMGKAYIDANYSSSQFEQDVFKLFA